MLNDKRLVRTVASRISKAANAAVVNALKGGWSEQETSITGKLLGRVEQALEGYSKNGIIWSSKTLTDHGPNTMEKEYGADFTGILDLDVPGYRIRKGFLAQSKLVKDGQINSAEFERMVGQCQDMLELSPDSFVFLYSKEGIRIVSAAAVVGVQKKRGAFDPSPLYSRDVQTFYEAHLECFIGDPRINEFTEEMLVSLRARSAIEINARGIGGR
jgi:hypothetical protein